MPVERRHTPKGHDAEGGPGMVASGSLNRKLLKTRQKAHAPIPMDKSCRGDAKACSNIVSRSEDPP